MVLWRSLCKIGLLTRPGWDDRQYVPGAREADVDNP